ncbi:MAG: 2-C-methyl-D-erythritol 4-phosphate cytidylyltransferase [Clostridiales bacterium]|nr:2-C-methyl-D-erythritol 4-phosphate cytidylyltransferase [Clostridiales bacterium]
MIQQKRPLVSAILVAAGNSTRMGTEESKLFLPLLKVPVIARTLYALEQAESIHEIVIVTRPQDLRQMITVIDQYQFHKVRAILPGGDTRQQSVGIGAAACPDSDYLAIHDGARPLIEPENIDRCVQDAVCHRASIVAVRMKDTVKEAGEDGFIASTPDRSRLWSVQTPQIFEQSLYLSALEQAEQKRETFTDDSQLIERYGAGVHICEGSYANLKITTPEDLTLAEQYLLERGVKEGEL